LQERLGVIIDGNDVTDKLIICFFESNIFLKFMETSFNINKRTRIFLAFTVIVLGTYVFWAIFLNKESFVPKEFLEANKKGAMVAANIADLSKTYSDNLAVINDLDKEEKYSEAIDLVISEMKRNEELRGKAYELSVELGKMANSLLEIKPERATEAAMKAINSETSLIIRLLNYNNYLNELLKVLNGKFANGEYKEGAVEDLIKMINNEADAINSLNEKYSEEMRVFEERTSS